MTFQDKAIDKKRMTTITQITTRNKTVRWRKGVDALNHHSGVVPQQCGCEVEATHIGSNPVLTAKN